MLLDDFLYSLVLKHLERAHNRKLFKLFGYMVMPNHVHLLILPEKDVSISTILRAIKQPFSHHALNHIRDHWPDLHYDLHTSRGSRTIRVFWQAGGGYDRNIFTSIAFENTLEYMHLNPVRKQFVQSPEEWKWSSARHYLKGVGEPLAIDVPEWL